MKISPKKKIDNSQTLITTNLWGLAPSRILPSNRLCFVDAKRTRQARRPARRELFRVCATWEHDGRKSVTGSEPVSKEFVRTATMLPGVFDWSRVKCSRFSCVRSTAPITQTSLPESGQRVTNISSTSNTRRYCRQELAQHRDLTASSLKCQ